MPSYYCRFPTCNVLMGKPGWCDRHAVYGAQAEAARQRIYDRQVRDPRAVAFYHSQEWLVARDRALCAHPICQQCGKEIATEAHHIEPLMRAWDLRIEPSNLWCVSRACHRKIEAGEPIASADFPGAGDARQGGKKIQEPIRPGPCDAGHVFLAKKLRG